MNNAISFALAQSDIVRRRVGAVDPEACERLINELSAAKRVFVGGAGRSLLSMKMFAMRLMQTNHSAWLVGEVCTPAIEPGDLLLVGSGSGETPSTLELLRKAKKNGARTALVTASPRSRMAAEADTVLSIPPVDSVDADDSEAGAFVRKNLPGNLFEAASLLVADGLIARIMEREGFDNGTIMRNHANLE